MTTLTLLASTGTEHVDQTLRGIIGLIELSFPGRVRGYYVEGSYADGTAVATSDIDMRVVFKGNVDFEERERFAQVRDYCRLISPYMLDIKPEGEAALFRIGAIRFQQGTLLAHGEDIRNAIPPKPMESYTRDLMHIVYYLFAQVRGNPATLAFPLDYPDPSGAFFGYDRREMRARDGTVHRGTKDLVTNAVSAATALIALRTGQYVITKRDCITQYRRWINDEWTVLLEAIYEQCRNQWGYLVPEAAADRERLLDLCRQALRFENYFLGFYQEYLLSELQHTDEAIRLFAVQRLGQIVFRDGAVVAALHETEKHGSAELQNAVADTLLLYSMDAVSGAE
jgi:hypothetical protein